MRDNCVSLQKWRVRRVSDAESKPLKQPSSDAGKKQLNTRGTMDLGERVNVIQQLEQEELARVSANREIPAFAPGDTVVVNVNVVEGTRKRVQAYEGVVIGRRNRGLNSSFVVRKVSSGEGVERTFQLYSPTIASIEVKRRGDVRRAKLYYLRDRSGKSARIREKLQHKSAADKTAADAAAADKTARDQTE